MSNEFEFSFLTSGPTFQASVPDILDRRAQLSSPILSGAGPRTFTYSPGVYGDELISGMRRDGVPIDTIQDRSGHQVEILRRPNDPPIWWMLWAFPHGALSTHLRGIDGGPDRAVAIAGATEVIEQSGHAYMFLYEPLMTAVSSRPGYQDEAALWSSDTSMGLTFVRPGFLSPGRMVSDETAGATRIRLGASGGLEIQVSSQTTLEEARSIAADIGRSLIVG